MKRSADRSAAEQRSALDRELLRLADKLENDNPVLGDERTIRRLEQFRLLRQVRLDIEDVRRSHRPLWRSGRFLIVAAALIGGIAIFLAGRLAPRSGAAVVEMQVAGIVANLSDVGSLALAPGLRLGSIDFSRADSLELPSGAGYERIPRAQGEPAPRDIGLVSRPGPEGEPAAPLTIAKLELIRPMRVAVETGADPWTTILFLDAESIDLTLEVSPGTEVGTSRTLGRSRALEFEEGSGLVTAVIADARRVRFEWTIHEFDRTPRESRFGTLLLEDPARTSDLHFLRDSDLKRSGRSTVLQGDVTFPRIAEGRRTLRAPQNLTAERFEGHLLELALREDVLRVLWSGTLVGAEVLTADQERSIMPTWIEVALGDRERRLTLILVFYFVLFLLAITRGETQRFLERLTFRIGGDD